MRAIIITAPGGSEVLEEQDRPVPEPGVGQIRVRVHASALNRADLMQREGRYPAPPGAPADIPGLEYAGEVAARGEGAMKWKVGARVMGIVAGGAHAEFVCVHEREAIAMPGGMSYDDAAAIPEAFLTAHDALFNQVSVRSGEQVLVHAVGSGVGTATLQLARAAGAIVIGTSRSDAKLERARALGLSHAIHAAADDWPMRIEEAIGLNAVHAVVDLVGGAYLRGNLQVLASRGRLVVVGLTAGRSSSLDLGVLLGKRLTVVGTVLRSRPLEEKIALARDFEERVVPVEEIRAAHDAMASDATFGKIVLRWE